jgi:hypothetical protein
MGVGAKRFILKSELEENLTTDNRVKI